MCKLHIALQELLAVALMLHRRAFKLSGKVVALLLHNTTLKAYLCNQGGTASPFLSRIAFCILNLADEHSIPAFMPSHVNVEGTNYQQVGWFLSSTFFLTYLRLHLNFGVNWR